MGSDNEKATKDGTPAPAETSPVGADQRVEARRRFLRGGAGGSVLMLTVTHRRAFAGKKGTVASACTSLQGVPDLTGVKDKKALELSAMGTPKGLICRPPKPMVDPYPLDTLPNKREAEFYKLEGTTYYKPMIYPLNEISDGVGTLEGTITAAYEARLYDRGYCPVILDAQGVLRYEHSAEYYVREGGKFVAKACKPAP